MIYGIYLPKDVLEKVYRKNAERVVLGGNKERPDLELSRSTPSQWSKPCISLRRQLKSPR
jgi:hypothetical protein